MISAVCDRARAWVSLDLDGGLSTFEKRMLDRHLDGCESCRRFGEESARFTLALRAAALEPAHVSLQLPRRRSHGSGVLAGVGTAAALAAAAVFAFGSGPATTQSARSASPLASGLAMLTTNADTLGVGRPGAPRRSRVVTYVRGAFGLPT